MQCKCHYGTIELDMNSYQQQHSRHRSNLMPINMVYLMDKEVAVYIHNGVLSFFVKGTHLSCPNEADETVACYIE